MLKLWMEEISQEKPNTEIRIYTWDAPFNAEPKALYKTKERFSDIDWGNAENAFVSEGWYDTRSTKTSWINPKQENLSLL